MFLLQQWRPFVADQVRQFFANARIQDMNVKTFKASAKEWHHRELVQKRESSSAGPLWPMCKWAHEGFPEQFVRDNCVHTELAGDGKTLLFRVLTSVYQEGCAEVERAGAGLTREGVAAKAKAKPKVQPKPSKEAKVSLAVQLAELRSLVGGLGDRSNSSASLASSPGTATSDRMV